MSSAGNDLPVDPEIDSEVGDEIEGGWFRRLVTYSLLSALSAAIPIPFVDEHLLRRTRRRLAREMAGQAGVTLHEIEINHLSGTGATSLSSCFFGCVIGQSFKVAVKLVRRVFRSVLIFLTVKDSVDAFSRTFHEGFLLHRALPGLGRQLDARKAYLEQTAIDAGADTFDADANPTLPRDRELVPEIQTLRSAIESTCSEVDTRPLESTIKTIFRQSRKVLRRAARVFARNARRAERIDPEAEPDAEEGSRLAPELIDLLTSSLQRNKGYLLELDRHFRARWGPGGTN